ncbi:hypothetical protein EVJ50_00730 [Synechococcus sp. RSCCF101]|uniref:hypothetical protein n=1 Tax=Synechococcus sp. RSCCF101 TaxID=2511069 RepID=UPI0012492CE3|nr:hypothetical protein [Synechococcus sp. RSCCF101]QEY30995.1 hypothetical protein EVJ50_00730 [Synechococcus sp. RSCCF101]
MPRTALASLLTLAAALPLSADAVRAETCTFLTPIGGDGSKIVKKRVERPKISPLGNALGRTNWNTDFAVDRPYRRYKLFFTADSTDTGTYPIEAYLKFTDNSNLQVVNQSMTPPMGTGKMFGPFPAVPGKQVSQVNFKVGTAKDPGASGFSYRISVQGCN